MRTIRYQRGDAAMLEKLAGKLPAGHGLRYPEFVDYYYAGSPWCSLRILLDDEDEVLGVLGLERMPFSIGDERLTLGFGTNFAAFAPGAGGLLFLQWMKDCDFGLMFGGSGDAHRLVQGRRWTRYANVRPYYLNRAYEFRPGEPWWRRLARKVLLRMAPSVDVAETARRVLRDGSPAVEVVEERRFTDDMLPEQTPFGFRFSPDAEYLDWRYHTELPFVRYRLFRIESARRPAGYVVINQRPSRLLVAQCDGDDPLVLCRGIFAALAVACKEVGRRCEVLLSSSHALMQETFRRYGFRQGRKECPFFIGGLNAAPQISADTSRWLVNFDWGDKGLRPPFLGRPSIRAKKT